MLKRLRICTFLCLCLLFTATACQSGGTESPDPEEPEDTSSSETSEESVQDENEIELELYYPEVYEKLTSTDVNSLHFHTDVTEYSNGIQYIEPDKDLVLKFQLLLAAYAGPDSYYPEEVGYQRYAKIGYYGEDSSYWELIFCETPEVAEYDTFLMVFTSDHQWGPEYYPLPDGAFDEAYELFTSATIAAEIPVEDFVAPIQRALALYGPENEDSLEPLFDPLPEGENLPAVETAADFTAEIAKSTTPYAAVIPLEGGRYRMVFGLDQRMVNGELAWDVIIVQFLDAKGTSE